MSHSQFHSTKLFILRHAWLNLWDKHMTTGRINQVTLFCTPKPDNQEQPHTSAHPENGHAKRPTQANTYTQLHPDRPTMHTKTKCSLPPKANKHRLPQPHESEIEKQPTPTHKQQNITLRSQKFVMNLSNRGLSLSTSNDSLILPSLFTTHAIIRSVSDRPQIIAIRMRRGFLIHTGWLQVTQRASKLNFRSGHQPADLQTSLILCLPNGYTYKPFHPPLQPATL